MAFLATLVVLAAFQTNFYNDGIKALDARQYQAAADADKLPAENQKGFPF